MGLIAALAALIFVADQVTKFFALRHLRAGMPVPVVDGFLSLTLVMNPGLAFGMLGGIPESLRWMVGVLSLGALLLLAVLAARVLPSGGPWARVSLGLIWRAYHWPAFNVADSAISVGVTLLALRMLVEAPAKA